MSGLQVGSKMLSQIRVEASPENENEERYGTLSRLVTSEVEVEAVPQVVDNLNTPVRLTWMNHAAEFGSVDAFPKKVAAALQTCMQKWSAQVSRSLMLNP